MFEALAMGKYAFYIWTSYAAFGVVMLWTFLTPILRRRRFIQNYREQQALAARRKKSHDTDS